MITNQPAWFSLTLNRAKRQNLPLPKLGRSNLRIPSSIRPFIQLASLSDRGRGSMPAESPKTMSNVRRRLIVAAAIDPVIGVRNFKVIGAN